MYFAEEAQDIVRPHSDPVPSTPGNSRTPRSNRRRKVPFGEENYHKCPGGSGDKLKVLNQMRAKASLEGSIPKEELKYLDEAMAVSIKDNAQQIVEHEQDKKRSELLAKEERIRKRDPSRLGGMIRGPRSGLIDFSTPWKNLFETPKTEYDVALDELGENYSEKKYYW